MKPDPTTAAGIVEQVRQALTEDIGCGDITAELIPPDAHLGGSVIAREPGVLCGRDWFDEVFRQLDPKLSIRWFAEDGATLHPDQQLCELSGQARSLLTGERTALNFVQLLSAVATRTHTYVNAVAGSNCRVLDTRKTLPGLRLAQKYAVRCGGGTNHRIGLFDAILLKENHIIAAGSIAQAVAQARTQNSDVLLEVEVETLAELEQALQAGADRVLLDNFNLDQLRQAVAQTTGRAELEASGGITLQTIAEIAATGVDFISVGELTKSVGALDLSMRLHQP